MNKKQILQTELFALSPSESSAQKNNNLLAARQHLYLAVNSAGSATDNFSCFVGEFAAQRKLPFASHQNLYHAQHAENSASSHSFLPLLLHFEVFVWCHLRFLR